MVQKRPLGEELCEISSKQPRQLEPTDEMISFLEFTDKSMLQKPYFLGGEPGGFSLGCNSEYDERLEGGDAAELQVFPQKDFETSVPGSISNSSWGTSTTSEEDIRFEVPFQILLPHDHYNLDHSVRDIIHDGDSYSSLLEYPPRKLVPIGREFQAEIPELGLHGDGKTSIRLGVSSEELNLSSQSLESDVANHLDDQRLCHSCVIPMPKGMSENSVKKTGGGRMDCYCADMGSIRCFRQHTTEAREELRKSVGEEIFLKLGFGEMGEVVSEKWSKEEESIFREVVVSNPVSLGLNFWDHLAVELPSKTMKEIVSYYFNVYVLRKRAEQNRIDPLNVDSDNDEWEATDAPTDEEAENTSELDHCGMGSLRHEDSFEHIEIHKDKYENRHPVHETSGDEAHGNFIAKRCSRDVSESFPNEVAYNCTSAATCEQTLSNEHGGQYVQDSPRVSNVCGTSLKIASRKEVRTSNQGTSSPDKLGNSNSREVLLRVEHFQRVGYWLP